MTDTVEAPRVPAASPPPAPGPPGAGGRRDPRTILAAVLYAFAAAPVISMVSEVLRAPRLQFYDYWFVLARVANPDGSLNPRGIFTYRNEHPTFIPGFIYWLDSRFLDGSNRTLGMLSILLAAITVVLLVLMLPRNLDGLKRAALTVAFTFLLFSPQGLHNFVMGMSGTGWLLANLVAAAALLAAMRGRILVAIGFAVIGCLSYGTAFALWPALALVHWLRRDHWWKVVLPLVAGVAVIVTWALTLDRMDAGPEGAARGLETLFAGFAGAAGGIWGSGGRELATILGVITLAALSTLIVLAARQRLEAGRPGPDGPAATQPDLPAVAPWLGLGVYALGSLAMIVLARHDEGLGSLLTSRYASVPALILCSLLGLAVIWFRQLRPVVVVPALLFVAVTTFSLSADRAQQVRDNYAKQEAIAVSMHVGAVYAILDDEFPAASVESARALRSYPFTDDFTLGCNGPEIGDRVDLRSATPLTPPPGRDGNSGTVDEADHAHGQDGLPQGWRLSGWALIGERRADCVLVVDRDNGRVVGGGAVGGRRRDVAATVEVDEGYSGWQAVASPAVTDPVVVLSSGGALYSLELPEPPQQ